MSQSTSRDESTTVISVPLAIRSWVLFVVAASILLGSLDPLRSETLTKALVRQAINNVYYYPHVTKKNDPDQAVAGKTVIQGENALRTGDESRSELLFNDRSVARLGAHSLFSFVDQTRSMNLAEGSMLLQVPKDSRTTTIRTGAATAAVTGTTIMIGHRPDKHVKMVVLEGTMTVSLRNRMGESVELSRGQMLVFPPDATRLPDPVTIDIHRLTETSDLIKGFEEDSASERYEASEERVFRTAAIEEAIQAQNRNQEEGILQRTNLMMEGQSTKLTVLRNESSSRKRNKVQRLAEANEVRTEFTRTSADQTQFDANQDLLQQQNTNESITDNDVQSSFSEQAILDNFSDQTSQFGFDGSSFSSTTLAAGDLELTTLDGSGSDLLVGTLDGDLSLSLHANDVPSSTDLYFYAGGSGSSMDLQFSLPEGTDLEQRTGRLFALSEGSLNVLPGSAFGVTGDPVQLYTEDVLTVRGSDIGSEVGYVRSGGDLVLHSERTSSGQPGISITGSTYTDPQTGDREPNVRLETLVPASGSTGELRLTTDGGDVSITNAFLGNQTPQANSVSTSRSGGLVRVDAGEGDVQLAGRTDLVSEVGRVKVLGGSVLLGGSGTDNDLSLRGAEGATVESTIGDLTISEAILSLGAEPDEMYQFTSASDFVANESTVTSRGNFTIDASDEIVLASSTFEGTQSSFDLTLNGSARLEGSSRIEGRRGVALDAEAGLELAGGSELITQPTYSTAGDILVRTTGQDLSFLDQSGVRAVGDRFTTVDLRTEGGLFEAKGSTDKRVQLVSCAMNGSCDPSSQDFEVSDLRGGVILNTLSGSGGGSLDLRNAYLGAEVLALRGYGDETITLGSNTTLQSREILRIHTPADQSNGTIRFESGLTLEGSHIQIAAPTMNFEDVPEGSIINDQKVHLYTNLTETRDVEYFQKYFSGKVEVKDLTKAEFSPNSLGDPIKNQGGPTVLATQQEQQNNNGGSPEGAGPPSGNGGGPEGNPGNGNGAIVDFSTLPPDITRPNEENVSATLYRGRHLDGPLTKFFYGSSREFDETVGLGNPVRGLERFAQWKTLNSYKFEDLRIGDLQLQLGDGGSGESNSKSFAFVAVNSLKLDPAFGNDGEEPKPQPTTVFFGTQNGSISVAANPADFNYSMGSETPVRWMFYARGPGADLTFTKDMTFAESSYTGDPVDGGILRGYAEDNVIVNNNDDGNGVTPLEWGARGITLGAGDRVEINRPSNHSAVLETYGGDLVLRSWSTDANQDGIRVPASTDSPDPVSLVTRPDDASPVNVGNLKVTTRGSNVDLDQVSLYSLPQGVAPSDVSTNEAGHLEASGVGGSFTGGSLRVASRGGDVNLDQSRLYTQSAEVDLDAGKGNVTLDDSRLRTDKGGDVSVRSSHGTIQVTNSSEIRSIVEAAANGGNVTVNSERGPVVLKGTDSNDRVTLENCTSGCEDLAGTMRIESGRSSVNGRVDLRDARLRAATLKLRAHGPSGELIVGNNSTLGASEIMRLYAPGSSGRVVFRNNVVLNGGGTAQIAGSTVEIVDGATVDNSGVSATEVYADRHQYDRAGYGSFSEAPTTKGSHSEAPRF